MPAAGVDPERSVMPAWLPAFNKRVTNRVQGVYAPYIPPLAVVVHVGRSTGKVYTTPVTAQLYDHKLAIALPYSANTQWVKNLQAAGGGELIRRGQRLTFTHPRVVVDPAGESFPPMTARLARKLAVLVADLSQD